MRIEIVKFDNRSYGIRKTRFCRKPTFLFLTYWELIKRLGAEPDIVWHPPQARDMSPYQSYNLSFVVDTLEELKRRQMRREDTRGRRVPIFKREYYEGRPGEPSTCSYIEGFPGFEPDFMGYPHYDTIIQA
jgi:hypothetical protein